MPELSERQLIELHKLCSRHKALLKATNLCGSFHCHRDFFVEEIMEWADKQQTAVCPWCHIDAVMPLKAVLLSDGSEVVIGLKVLYQMDEHFFGLANAVAMDEW